MLRASCTGGGRGYAEVAVVTRLPSSRIPREFADPERADGIDLAVVQSHGFSESATYTHELLHLFGAGDLYRLNVRDERDTGDVMGGPRDSGRLDSHIHDTTAWAIGWRRSPPPRVYPIAGVYPTADEPLGSSDGELDAFTADEPEYGHDGY